MRLKAVRILRSIFSKFVVKFIQSKYGVFLWKNNDEYLYVFWSIWSISGNFHSLSDEIENKIISLNICSSIG